MGDPEIARASRLLKNVEEDVVEILRDWIKEHALEIYSHPEKFGFSKNEINTVKKSIESMYPELFVKSDNDMVKYCKDYLDKLEETPELKRIKTWIKGLKFPENDKDTNELINIAIKALKAYGIFHKGTDKAITFLKSIQVSDCSSYEELYNSFTEDERKMTDEYYKGLFEKSKVTMTDKEREAIKRGACLLRDFKHPELYDLLEKFFPKDS